MVFARISPVVVVRSHYSTGYLRPPTLQAFARGDFPINCIVQIQESGINNLAGDKWCA